MQNTDDDIIIWNELLAGNDLVYECIYKNHVQALFKYGLSLTTDEDLVKDCIQDIFIRIYENRKKLGTTDNIRFYLLSALKNSIIVAFRKQKISNNYKYTISIKEWSDSETAIDKIISSEENEEQMAFIDKIWSILTNRQKKIVYYRYIEGLSITEIAKQENIDYHSVANIIQRAINKIKKYYSKSD